MNASKHLSIAIIASATFSMQCMESQALTKSITQQEASSIALDLLNGIYSGYSTNLIQQISTYKNAFTHTIEHGSTEKLKSLFDTNNNNQEQESHRQIYLETLKLLANKKDNEWQQRTRNFALKTTALGALSLAYHYMINSTMHTDDHIAFHAGTSALLVGFVTSLFTNYTDPATGIIYSFIAEQSKKK